MPLRCEVQVALGTRRFFDGDKLVLVAFPDGTFVDRRAHLGYSPPFLQILPCPYCGVTEDRNHDVLAHVDTHKKTTLFDATGKT